MSLSSIAALSFLFVIFMSMDAGFQEFFEDDVGEPTEEEKELFQVKEVMDPDPLTVTPDTPTVDAIELMRGHGVSCLPVLKEGRLVGMVSEREFMPIAYQLLKDKLGA